MRDEKTMITVSISKTVVMKFRRVLLNKYGTTHGVQNLVIAELINEYIKKENERGENE